MGVVTGAEEGGLGLLVIPPDAVDVAAEVVYSNDKSISHKSLSVVHTLSTRGAAFPTNSGRCS